MLGTAEPARWERDPGRRERPWAQSPWVGLALAATLALATGVLTAAVSPLAVAAGLAGLALLLLVLARPVAGLFLFVAVTATLPFGVIPVRIGVQLTFVDAVLVATFAGFLLRLPALAQRRGRLVLGAPGLLLLLFVCVAAVAFASGAIHSGASADLARRFAKLVASLLVFVVGINLVRDRRVLYSLARSLMLGGALAGAVGTALWLLSPATQLRILTALNVVGYPTADVLRYVPGPNATYTTQLRATGTAVDPNVFGGTMMLALAVIAMQWAARERLLSRPALLLLALPTLCGMLLSFSRASWLGLVAGVLFVGSLRYRRIWLGVAVVLVVLLALPIGQEALERFASGFSSADRATALRWGEYRNALTLIGRYPLLGIGFGPSPDIDVTAGVSSVYLLVGEQTGLLGLASYLAALGAALLAATRALRAGSADERLAGALSGLLAAIAAALVAGLLDHYFANQVFPHAVALFWLYAALLVGAARLATAAARA